MGVAGFKDAGCTDSGMGENDHGLQNSGRVFGASLATGAGYADRAIAARSGMPGFHGGTLGGVLDRRERIESGT